MIKSSVSVVSEADVGDQHVLFTLLTHFQDFVAGPSTSSRSQGCQIGRKSANWATLNVWHSNEFERKCVIDASMH